VHLLERKEFVSYVPFGIDTLHLQEHMSCNKSDHFYSIIVRVRFFVCT
jgi:hypothetical protein